MDESLSRRSGGTGLGLLVCKRFIELHGGSIGAESLYGHGSTLWFLSPGGGSGAPGTAPPGVSRYHYAMTRGAPA